MIEVVETLAVERGQMPHRWFANALWILAGFHSTFGRSELVRILASDGAPASERRK